MKRAHEFDKDAIVALEWDEMNYGDYLLFLKRVVIDGENPDEMETPPHLSMDTLRQVLLMSLVIVTEVLGSYLPPGDVYDNLINNYVCFYESEGEKFIIGASFCTRGACALIQQIQWRWASKTRTWPSLREVATFTRTWLGCSMREAAAKKRRQSLPRARRGTQCYCSGATHL